MGGTARLKRSGGVAIERFEDIVAWQQARVLVEDVYETTRSQPFERDFGLRNQLQRAAVSTMSNIAEGFERRSPKENLHILSIARASNGEVRSLLYDALDAGYLQQVCFDRLMENVIRVARLVTSFRSSIDRYVKTISEEPAEYDQA